MWLYLGTGLAIFFLMVVIGIVLRAAQSSRHWDDYGDCDRRFRDALVFRLSRNSARRADRVHRLWFLRGRRHLCRRLGDSGRVWRPVDDALSAAIRRDVLAELGNRRVAGRNILVMIGFVVWCMQVLAG